MDITRLKEAEKAVTESEEKYRSVIEQSYNGVVLSNEEGKIIEWNRSMEEITGLAENEVHGKYLSTIILQSLPPMFKSHLASHLKEDLSRIYRDQEVPPSFKKNWNTLSNGRMARKDLLRPLTSPLNPEENFSCAPLSGIFPARK